MRKDVGVLVSRVAGAVAAGATLVGMVVLGGAVIATQGLVYPGFVSEAGAPGQPHVSAYTCGIVAIAAGLLLLAVALYAGASSRYAMGAGWLCAASAVLATVSSSVPCSPGCPLPPFATPTAQDLVHGGASTLGVAMTGLAVLLLALAPQPGPLRRLSRAFLWPLVPLGGTVAVALAFLGQGWLLGITERATLLTILAWTAFAGALTARGSAL